MAEGLPNLNYENYMHVNSMIILTKWFKLLFQIEFVWSGSWHLHHKMDYSSIIVKSFFVGIEWGGKESGIAWMDNFHDRNYWGITLFLEFILACVKPL